MIDESGHYRMSNAQRESIENAVDKLNACIAIVKATQSEYNEIRHNPVERELLAEKSNQLNFVAQAKEHALEEFHNCCLVLISDKG